MKIKALERNKIIAKQNKRIWELVQSRDYWKLCFKNLKNSLALNAKNSKDFSAKNQVAKGHCYPLFLVLFCVQYLGYGAQSFRSCVHSLAFLIGGYFYEIKDQLSEDNNIIWLAELGGGKGKVTRGYILKGIAKVLEMKQTEEFLKK